jgi:hypothetical protein
MKQKKSLTANEDEALEAIQESGTSRKNVVKVKKHSRFSITIKEITCREES